MKNLLLSTSPFAVALVSNTNTGTVQPEYKKLAWRPRVSGKIDPRVRCPESELGVTRICYSCEKEFILETGVVYYNFWRINGVVQEGLGTFCSGICLMNILPEDAMARA